MQCSSGGPDGLTPQHLRDMVTADCNSNTLLTSLTDFINGLFQGMVPTNVLPIFLEVNSLRSLKEDGGIRPIAIGYTLSRLAGKRHIVMQLTN